MKRTVIALAVLAATTGFIAKSHAQTTSNRNLSFYGAQLPYETVQVTAYSRDGEKIEIKGNVTMTHDQWVLFSNAVIEAGFPVSQGEPRPIGVGGSR